MLESQTMSINLLQPEVAFFTLPSTLNKFKAHHNLVPLKYEKRLGIDMTCETYLATLGNSGQICNQLRFQRSWGYGRRGFRF